jgi:predicted small metal-binding protein
LNGVFSPFAPPGIFLVNRSSIMTCSYSNLGQRLFKGEKKVYGDLLGIMKEEEDQAMGRREYKQFGCREIGMDCDFLVRSATRDQVMRLATEHACEDHQICKITPEFRDKLSSQIQDIWCDGEKCSQPHWETEAPYYWG